MRSWRGDGPRINCNESSSDWLIDSSCAHVALWSARAYVVFELFLGCLGEPHTMRSTQTRTLSNNMKHTTAQDSNAQLKLIYKIQGIHKTHKNFKTHETHHTGSYMRLMWALSLFPNPAARDRKTFSSSPLQGAHIIADLYSALPQHYIHATWLS